MPLNATTAPNGRPITLRLAWVVLLASAFVLLTGLLDGGVGVAPKRLLDQPRFLFANAMPGLVLASLLLVWSRRALLSFGLAFLLQVVLYGVNALKVDNLGTPLLPDDFRIIGQLGKGGLHILGGYLPDSPWPYLALLSGVLLITAMWRYEPPVLTRRTGRIPRWLAAATLMLAFGTMLAGASVWTRIYNGRVLWLEPWSATSTTKHSGLLSSLMLFHLHYGHGKRTPDRAAASELISDTMPALKRSLDAPTRGGELPDIVVVQSESFFDPTSMRGYEQSNFTPNLKRLAAHGVSGKLHVPTFGGGTIRTEFEFLTGLSLRYFDNLQFPYLQMNSQSIPSLVRTLNARGYATVALHGNDPAFWNRTTAFKSIGFDRFESRSSFPADAPKDGIYMADSAMTEQIMTLLKDDGPPQFVFAISIEAHGPYDVPPANEAARDAIAVPEGIDGHRKRELQTYLYHLKNADAELGRLARLLAKRERPTLVLFYGDHLPALGSSYEVTGFVDGKGMLSQASTWLMFDPHKPIAPTREDTASWLLPSLLLQKLGINDDPYFVLTGIVGPALASLTEAPGASPPTQDLAEQRLDRAMDSVNQLRMDGKLDKMLATLLDAATSSVVQHPANATSPGASTPPAAQAVMAQ